MAKTEWYSIDSTQMMRDTMGNFLKFLKDNKVKYKSYSTTGNKIYMEIMFPIKHKEEWEKRMVNWCVYQPIQQLTKKPKVSDYDIIEDMSIDPYGW